MSTDINFDALEGHNTAYVPGNDYSPTVSEPQDGTEVGTIAASSVLDELRKSTERALKDVTSFPVPEGTFPDFPGVMYLEFSTNISTHELSHWQKQSRGRGRRRADDIDAGKASALVLVNKSTRILLDGKALVDDDGEPLTLRSEEILGLTGSHNAVDGVRRLLRDGVVTSMADALTAEAGYAGELEPVGNPT